MPRKPYTDRSSWTLDQIAIVERLIELARGIRGGTRWADHVEAIGHPLSSITSMAHYLRNKTLKDRYRVENEGLRQRARDAARAAREKPAAPRDYAGHMSLTPKCKLVFDQELLDRIRERGLTAGFFGDPLPGRSALDRKLAAIVS